MYVVVYMTICMKNLILSLFCLGASLTACSQPNTKPAPATPITIGSIDSLHSDILQEDRSIWVYVPGGDRSGYFSQQRYPVVYLLDGDAHFTSVVGMMEQLSSVNGNDICPQMIVVGITNTDRMRDLSPTHVERGPYLNAEAAKTTGGGEAFLSFLEKELMPYIESKYPTAPYRMLIGHSLGGLLAMHALVHHPSMFNSYVAIDPSMWWDSRKLLKETEQTLATGQKMIGKTLYLGIANTLESDMDFRTVERDTSQASEHIRSILALDKTLKTSTKSQLKYQSKYYSDDTHGSAAFITEYDALRFIFDFYPLKLRGKDYQDTTGIVLDKIREKCALRSEKMGYSVKPSEDLFNNLGYQALGSGRLELAGRYFRQNIEYYPESFNVYDSYGDYFVAKGDTANAILQFEKSLSKKETPETRKKLDGLK